MRVPETGLTVPGPAVAHNLADDWVCTSLGSGAARKGRAQPAPSPHGRQPQRRSSPERNMVRLLQRHHGISHELVGDVRLPPAPRGLTGGMLCRGDLPRTLARSRSRDNSEYGGLAVARPPSQRHRPTPITA